MLLVQETRFKESLETPRVAGWTRRRRRLIHHHRAKTRIRASPIAEVKAGVTGERNLSHRHGERPYSTRIDGVKFFDQDTFGAVIDNITSYEDLQQIESLFSITANAVGDLKLNLQCKWGGMTSTTRTARPAWPGSTAPLATRVHK